MNYRYVCTWANDQDDPAVGRRSGTLSGLVEAETDDEAKTKAEEQSRSESPSPLKRTYTIIGLVRVDQEEKTTRII